MPEKSRDGSDWLAFAQRRPGGPQDRRSVKRRPAQ